MLKEVESKWEDYCCYYQIRDPFEFEVKLYKQRIVIKDNGKSYIRDYTPEELSILPTKKEKQDYLLLKHTFYLWELHKILDWEHFKWYLDVEDYADTSIYYPCDAADGSCTMTCKHFGKKCPRETEELKNPVNKLVKIL